MMVQSYTSSFSSPALLTYTQRFVMGITGRAAVSQLQDHFPFSSFNPFPIQPHAVSIVLMAFQQPWSRSCFQDPITLFAKWKRIW